MSVSVPEHESNRAACEASLAELDKAGRLKDVDAARVQAIRSIAEALDGKGQFNSQMWREYRDAWTGLTADDGNDGDALDGILGTVPASVRN